METIELADGYSRNKKPAILRFRRMTVREAMALRYGQTIPFKANAGTARNVKINGNPQTWKSKKNAGRVRVPVKYGMYEYSECLNDGPDDGNPDSTFVERLLVPLD